MTAQADRITATILGCASSGGVPRVGNNWGDCDPKNPRNRRRRCSLLLTGTSSGSDGCTQVLIDTGCDLREQLLDAEVSALDGVLYTHEHADHTHGIDDLRALALSSRRRVDVYFTPETGERVRQAFGYCFDAKPDSPYPPILNAHEIGAGDTIEIIGEGGGQYPFPPSLRNMATLPPSGFALATSHTRATSAAFPSNRLRQFLILMCGYSMR